MSLGVGMQILGGTINGYGEARANGRVADVDEDLAADQRRIRALTNPLGRAIAKGWEDGGALRTARRASLLGELETNLATNRTKAGESAYRFGGAGSPMALRRWQDAKVAHGLGEAGVDQKVDLEALDTLARLVALQYGYKSAFNPETRYDNRFAWAGPAATEFAKAYGNGSSTQGRSWNTYIPQSTPQEAQENPDSMDYFSYFPY